MDRIRNTRPRPLARRPHARGDGPERVPTYERMDVQAPRTWGWTDLFTHPEHKDEAGPTHVGMDRAANSPRTAGLRRPHARGDGPQTYDELHGIQLQADRKSTRLNSSHVSTSYAAFCL